MPLVETLPVTDGTAQWEVWSTTARLVVADPARLAEAVGLVRAELAAVDAAASRFRPDSEVRRIVAAAGRPVEISARLASLIDAALTAARDTDGDVDPTVGYAMHAIGYTDALPIDAHPTAGGPADIAPAADQTAVGGLVGAVDPQRTSRRHGRRGLDHDGPATSSSLPIFPPSRRHGPGHDGLPTGSDLVIFPSPGWREIRLDGTRLIVPRGILLDLGATAKAWAADRAAAIVAARLDTGVLVALGGDIATAGPDSWPVLVRDGAGEPGCTVTLPAGAALATSSTIARTWNARSLHHILDPRTGRPAPRAWRTVSVAANSCVGANTLTTAAVVRGRSAVAWLRSLGAPARLVAADGTVTTIGSWP